MNVIIPISLSFIVLLAGCGSSGSSTTESEASTKESLGKELFFDTNLSLQRTMSCSTCHDEERAFVDGRFHDEADANPVNGALSLGDDGLSLGGRNAPTAAYAQFIPVFSQQDDDSYIGGQFHDGRADDLKAQAKGPFLDTAEMMMPDEESVIDRIKENVEYVEVFKTLYGDDVFDDIDVAYDAVAESIAKFEKTELFAPFDSKYDRFKSGEYTMSEQEDLGYSLFFSEANTNCVTCHSIDSESEGEDEIFSNFEYENIGTPKNFMTLDAKGLSHDTQDLGLGGRDDVNDTIHYGKMKVPTLRNVAVTGPYMTNGVFQELRTVLEFYDHMAGQGDHLLNPETGETWDAPDVNETVNYEVLQATQALSDAKIDAIIAFLKLLTDERYEHLISEE